MKSKYADRSIKSNETMMKQKNVGIGNFFK